MNELRTNEDRLLGTLRDLIRIPSVNPSLVPGGDGEAAVGAYVEGRLARLGLSVERQDLGAGRVNVIATLKGAGRGRSLMLNGHLDTVGVVGMEIDPFDPRVEGNRVYGRGSADMKGGLAAMIEVAEAMVEGSVRLAGDLILTFVADEEYASMGTERVAQTHRADAAIVCEFTGLDIVNVHKGFAWVRVDVRGVAAHGSLAGEGVDAIAKAGRFLVEMERYGRDVLGARSHPVVGSPSVHASLVKGGTELSTYPDRCLVELERRVIPGETRQMVADEMAGLLRAAGAGDPRFKADAELFFYRSPMEVAPGEPIVKGLERAHQVVTGRPADLGGMGGWCDTSILTDAGIPAVLYGPGGVGVHAAVEWASFDSVVTATKVLGEVVREFCGG
ncbi:MAG: ArgE/DapE family deacylase, partial [Bacillota bacterium]